MMPVSRYLCIFINVGLGEAAKRNVGTGAGQIPDMSFFSSLRGGNGYFSLPDNTIVQYGSATTIRNNEVGIVTLPFSFPSRFSQVLITHDDASTTGAIAFGSATPKTVSTFQVVVQKLKFNTSTGAVTLKTDASPCYVRYIAIGS
ncbi:phage tail protein [Escherichia coli]|uniref:gp53-like domain-containing protein n=1 Tax=Escherichia coli TaxID=562 RepID=UPI00128EDAFC|nr:phage tail protein [Escherichia coli]